MQEVNWNNFKAKFNDRENTAFETLCYHLFCAEFHQDKGIPSYKNQTGIETEPIEVNGEWIGFQSKFYETKLSENKRDIKDSIKKAKDKNPQLTKIYFYTHQDFSESPTPGKKEPDYKTDIERYAQSLNVEIDWRGSSHIQRQLAFDKNRTLAEHYFSLGKSFADFVAELSRHTEAILTPIHSKIEFRGTQIKIDRTLSLIRLRSDLQKSPLVILSGEGGVGKTALVKDFYEGLDKNTPFFVFKATEFNVPNINNLFACYGDFTLVDFAKEFGGCGEKYVVIDSAEKLSDLEEPRVFQEFISTLLNAGWKVIFTTRHSYLDDLRCQFVGIYHLSFRTTNIEDLTLAELTQIARKNNFALPADQRLLDLLRNPFYLNEYLQIDQGVNRAGSVIEFKNLLWNKKIAASSFRKNNIHRKREECFLRVAQKRANDGHFFVTADECDSTALELLEADEIIKSDSNSGGYFITHDIFEEWALDKTIERSFRNSATHTGFLALIGSSLPIRRAFRHWLSEKLLSERDEIKPFIEDAVTNAGVEDFWRDEILVSVLLSDYADVFFQLFEPTLLANKQALLVKIVFLLRIACKEIDEHLLASLGLKKTDGNILQSVFTQPRGAGWSCAIAFIHKHIGAIGLDTINAVLPLLYDWNNKNRVGETTRQASLIGLFYYDEITKRRGFGYGSRDGQKEQLIRVILQGASEIKDELKGIFEEVLSNGRVNYGDKYYPLIQATLTSITDFHEVVKSLPEYILRLAELCWWQSRERKDEGYIHGVEKYFSVTDNHDFSYFPASAYQTPIFWLLQVAPKMTVDFILSFTNRAAEFYAKSMFDSEVKEIEVFINEAETVKQYISGRLWSIYRGTATAPYLLDSIHMALEKWLLDYAKIAQQEHLEAWCKYLIRNSKSASITAVVVSIVLSQPAKLFNIAKILFQTREFFPYETARLVSDQSAKLLYSVGYGLDYKSDIFRDERIETCEGSYRKLSLEHLALNYQLFRSEEETDEGAEQRQKAVWAILDKYYEQLPDKAEETDADKTWRLYLARMDRRKMSPQVEAKDGKWLVTLNPELDPELKAFSEDSLQEVSVAMKYNPLFLWSNSRFKREENNYKNYPQYEDNPQFALSDVKELLKLLGEQERERRFSYDDSIPSYVCAVLLRDFADKLNSDEKEFCGEVIVAFASRPLRVEQYYYQAMDGIEAAISCLPFVLKYFPENKDKIKSLLFILLLDGYRKNTDKTAKFAVQAILFYLWESSFADAQSLFLGYLLLKPKYEALYDKARREHFKNFSGSDFSEKDVFERFLELHDEELENIVSNKVTFDDIGAIEQVNPEFLQTAFELLPLKTTDEVHKRFVNAIIPIFCKQLQDNRERSRNIYFKPRFLEKLAYFVLSSPKQDIEAYIKPIVEHLTDPEVLADLFGAFVAAEDRLNQYEGFWTVWNVFYDKVADICDKRRNGYYANKLIHNYLLAGVSWKPEAKDWHTIKEREKQFFKKVAQDMGHSAAVLYALSKLLNEIGSGFLADGILWIGDMLQKNQNLLVEEPETNTIYYLETAVRKYILAHRQKVKKDVKTKTAVSVILDFLVARGSVTGYLLRDAIL